jgi:hypothetical protein
VGDCVVGVVAAGAVVVAGAAVVAGGVVVVAAVVGGWIAGSDFSPQPAAATARPPATSASGSSVRLPRSELTGGHANGLIYAASE